jgi:hypothetical protein
MPDIPDDEGVTEICEGCGLEFNEGELDEDGLCSSCAKWEDANS